MLPSCRGSEGLLCAPQGTGAAESLSPEASAPLGQGSPLDKFVRQVALLKEACLMPSGMDEALRYAAFPLGRAACAAALHARHFPSHHTHF